MSGDSSQRVARQRPDLPDFRIPEHGHTHPRNGGALDVSTLGGSGGSGGSSGSGTDATSIRGINVSPTSPTNGQELVYNSTSGQYEPSTDAAGSLPWFIPTTNTDTAINVAIAAFNAAGFGVLYLPSGLGTYVCSGALTTITAAGLVLGDGMGGYDGQSSPATLITCTSQTAVLFTVTNQALTFRGLAIQNTYAGTPSAGSAIYVTSANIGQKVDFDGIAVRGFYDCIDVAVGAQWSMRNCYIAGPVRYGLRIRNTVNADAGDWSISDSWFYGETYNSTSAIRVESAGGGKLVNVKVNEISSKRFATGIDVSIASGNDSSILNVVGCSIENVSGDAISVATTGTGVFGLVIVSATEVGLYGNNAGRAVKINAGTAGGFTPGGIGDVIVTGCTFRTDGTARAAISLTNADNVILSAIALDGFNAYVTQTGSTNVRDDTGGVALGVQITGTPTSGQVPTASSGTAAAWATPSALSSPLTTKGDVWGYSTLNARIPIGADGSRLRADSTQTLGLFWSALVWTPVTVLDPGSGNYLPLTDGSGNQIMAEA